MVGWHRIGVLVCSSLAVLAGCSSDEGASSKPTCGDAVGNWRFGDDNLFLSVTSACAISNFCSIRENIHTRGTASATELELDAVAGQPLSFGYRVSAEQLTIIAAFQGQDLQLERLNGALPSSCPAP